MTVQARRLYRPVVASVDLAPDQCTIYYDLDGGSDVKRFDVCTGTQLRRSAARASRATPCASAVGPYLVGLMKDATGSTDGGLVTLAAILAIGSVLATRVAHDPAVERARRPSDRFSRKPRVAAPERVRPVV